MVVLPVRPASIVLGVNVVLRSSLFLANARTVARRIFAEGSMQQIGSLESIYPRCGRCVMGQKPLRFAKFPCPDQEGRVWQDLRVLLRTVPDRLRATINALRSPRRVRLGNRMSCRANFHASGVDLICSACAFMICVRVTPRSRLLPACQCTAISHGLGHASDSITARIYVNLLAEARQQKANSVNAFLERAGLVPRELLRPTLDGGKLDDTPCPACGERTLAI